VWLCAEEHLSPYREPNPNPNPRLSSDRTDCHVTNQLSCLPAVGRHSAVSATEIDQLAGSGNSSWNIQQPFLCDTLPLPFPNSFFLDLVHKTNFTDTRMYARQTLVRLLHVSTRCRCAIIGESSVTSSKRSVAQ
jgi:hypothetical protein